MNSKACCIPRTSTGPTTRIIFEAIERPSLKRVVLDSLSNSGFWRRVASLPPPDLALKHYFARHKATVRCSTTSRPKGRTRLRSRHGVIALNGFTDYGAERRRLRIQKMRGQSFGGGYHDFTIKTGGVNVFPRLVAAGTQISFERNPLSSGVAGTDALLGGGVQQGSGTLVRTVRRGKEHLHVAVGVCCPGRGEKAAMSSSTKSSTCCSIGRTRLAST